jgi:hypothetical protein
MSQEYYPQSSYSSSEKLPSTNTNTPPTSAAEERKQMGRRALIAAAGLGVVGIGVAEAPKILDGVGHLTEQELQNAINFGRQQLAKELASIEGVGIEVAVDVAGVTRFAIDYVATPILTVLADVTDGLLGGIRGAVQLAQQFTKLVHAQVTFLQQLDQILAAWQTNVSKFPLMAKAIGDSDTGAAQKYLTALKAKLEQEASK